MCRTCDELRRQIKHYNVVTAGKVDKTVARLLEAYVEKLEARLRVAVHDPPNPATEVPFANSVDPSSSP